MRATGKITTQLKALGVPHVLLDGTDPANAATRRALWAAASVKAGTYPVLYHRPSGIICTGESAQAVFDSSAQVARLCGEHAAPPPSKPPAAPVAATWSPQRAVEHSPARAMSMPVQKRGGKDDKVGQLLSWCALRVNGAPYNLELSSFRSSPTQNKCVADGRLFCALLHEHFPKDVHWAAIKEGDTQGNCTLAFRVAEEKAGVVRLLDVEDMVELYPRPEYKSIVVYVSFLHRELSKLPRGVGLASSQI